jgi:hypothetical protein
MEVPDYFLPRPAAAPDVDAFEALWAAQVEPGTGGAVGYRLPDPRWQFLCWLADTKAVVLHGSGHASIEEFEPRKADDVSEFGARTAVFAASDGLWPMYFALVDRGRVQSLVNGCAHAIDLDGGRSGDYYYFSIDQEALATHPWRPGTVYVLPRETFEPQPEEEWHGLRLASTQWASPVPVRPLARIAVRPEDFPFLDRVNGHDPEVVGVRAAADPGGFPWRD